MDSTDSGLCLMEDLTSTGPHINIGAQYQAEIPEFQDPSHLQLEEEEDKAWLVWDPETPDRVTELLDLARSSNVPRANTIIERALHCLHEARGNVLEALEMLRQGDPQPNQDHPLAGYHYTGMDTWTPLEQQLFDKAFHKYQTNFHQLQKEIPTKTIPQCVEYYFTWKMKRRLGYKTVFIRGGKAKRLQELEELEEKTVCSPRKRRRVLPNENLTPKRQNRCQAPHQPSCSSEGSGFSYPECHRLFNTTRGRNSHMKIHRYQQKTGVLG